MTTEKYMDYTNEVEKFINFFIEFMKTDDFIEMLNISSSFNVDEILPFIKFKNALKGKIPSSLNEEEKKDNEDDEILFFTFWKNFVELKNIRIILMKLKNFKEKVENP